MTQPTSARSESAASTAGASWPSNWRQARDLLNRFGRLEDGAGAALRPAAHEALALAVSKSWASELSAALLGAQSLGFFGGAASFVGGEWTRAPLLTAFAEADQWKAFCALVSPFGILQETLAQDPSRRADFLREAMEAQNRLFREEQTPERQLIEWRLALEWQACAKHCLALDKGAHAAAGSISDAGAPHPRAVSGMALADWGLADEAQFSFPSFWSDQNRAMAQEWAPVACGFFHETMARRDAHRSNPLFADFISKGLPFFSPPATPSDAVSGEWAHALSGAVGEETQLRSKNNSINDSEPKSDALISISRFLSAQPLFQEFAAEGLTRLLDGALSNDKKRPGNMYPNIPSTPAVRAALWLCSNATTQDARIDELKAVTLAALPLSSAWKGEGHRSAAWGPVALARVHFLPHPVIGYERTTNALQAICAPLLPARAMSDAQRQRVVSAWETSMGRDSSLSPLLSETFLALIEAAPNAFRDAADPASSVSQTFMAARGKAPFGAGLSRPNFMALWVEASRVAGEHGVLSATQSEAVVAAAADTLEESFVQAALDMAGDLLDLSNSSVLTKTARKAERRKHGDTKEAARILSMLAKAGAPVRLSPQTAEHFGGEILALAEAPAIQRAARPAKAAKGAKNAPVAQPVAVAPKAKRL